MLSLEDDVEAHALHRQGWTISAIARHLGRSRSTIRAYLAGTSVPGQRRRSAPDSFAAIEPYARARLKQDAHVWASALYDEVQRLGYVRSYQRFTHELRVRGLRPHCEACAGVRGRPTIEIEHPAGEEIQWDWNELPSPWGEGDVHLLTGTLAYSGQSRGVFTESEDQPHLIEAIDRVLRMFGGTARQWRFDRMGTVVVVGTGRILASFAGVAKHYGADIAICPARHGNRKGCVEKAIHFATQRWWRTAVVTGLEQATCAFEEFQRTTGDGRERHGVTVAEAARDERLLSLPPGAYPATVVVGRGVGPSALVEFRGNKYSVPPGFVGRDVAVQHRLCAATLEIIAGSGVTVAQHRLAPAGAGLILRLPEHHDALERAVLAAYSTALPCRRKENRPPGPEALAAAAVLRGTPADEVTIDLGRYAELAEVAR
jgi:transposase